MAIALRSVAPLVATLLVGHASWGQTAPGPAPASTASAIEALDWVPPAFGAGLTVVHHGPGKFDVELWGRRYEFRGSPVPEQVYTQGERFVRLSTNSRGYVPHARVTLERADASGTDNFFVDWASLEVVSERRREVVIEARGTVGDRLAASCTATIEYDGMLHFAFEYSPLPEQQEVKITRLRNAVYLAASEVELFSYHQPYDFERKNLVAGSVLDSAGAFPDELWLEFTPAVFAGNRDIGIEIWFETNRHWTARDRPIKLKVHRASALAEVSAYPILRTPVVLEPNESWQDAFTWFPLPMRPPEKRHTRRVAWMSTIHPERCAGNAELCFDLDLHDYYQISFLGSGGTSFTPEFAGLFQPKRNAASQPVTDLDLFDPASSRYRGVRYVPYGLLHLAPYHPTTRANESAWRANTASVTPRFADVLGLGSTHFACAGRSDYFDWHREETASALRIPDWPIGGVYYDYGSLMRMCARSPLLDGAAAKSEIWEYRNLRDYYKRLYETIHFEGLDAITTSHQHGSPKALMAFVDISVIGEALNEHFCTVNERKDQPPTCSAYDPDYFALADGWLDAQLHPTVGGTTMLLPQTRCDRWLDEDPDQPPPPSDLCTERQRQLHALNLVNDFPVQWASGYTVATTDIPVPDEHSTVEIYHAVDLFGNLDDAEFHGWWENGSSVTVTTTPPDVDARVSVYAHAGGKRLLVVVANYDDVALSEVDVQLDTSVFRLPSPAYMRNPELHGEAGGDARRVTTPGLVSTDGSIEPKGFQLVLVEPVERRFP